MNIEKKYYIHTYGCQSNIADSERVAAVLENLGYAQAENEKMADIIVFNTCSVRQSAEDRVFGKNKILKELKTKNQKLKVVLTGCMHHHKESVLKKRLPYVDIFLPIRDLMFLPEKLGKTLQEKPEEYLSIAPKHSSNFRALIPISFGCNNFCTYCIVPFSRGREYSRPAQDIINEAKNAIKKGCREIWLLGQNVNSYGIAEEKTVWDNKTRQNMPPKIQDGRMTFANLMRQVNNIPGNFRLRFTSPHPKDFSDDLIEAMQSCGRFPHYINLPVQSGDNEVLARMNRTYTREHYINLVGKIRKAMPDISMSTDTIVGFPGETEKQFQNTVDLYKTVEFDMAFIAKYSPRPKTAADIAFKDDIGPDEKERRRKLLTEVLMQTAQKNNEKCVGAKQRVLIDEEKNGIFYGKNESNKTVEIMNNAQNIPFGTFVDVIIKEATPWRLKGLIS